MTEMKATFTGRPNPALWYQTLARLLSEQHGAEIRLERLRDRQTGEVIWEAGRAEEKGKSA